MLTAQHGHVEVVKYLADRGADVHSTNKVTLQQYNIARHLIHLAPIDHYDTQS